MDKFVETQDLPSLNHKEIENLNRPITSKEIESVFKNLSTKKALDLTASLMKLYQTFKELLSKLLKLFKEIKDEGIHSNSFYKTSITLISKPGKDTIRK